MARLLLVRHAETGCGGRMEGWTDASLNEIGKAQATRLAAHLAAASYDIVYCSDLRRARQTAAPAVGGRPLVVSDALREMNFGEWENRTYEELTAHFPEAARRWQGDPVHITPPGGESLAQVAERCAALLPEFEAQARVLVVSHGGTLRALLCHLLGIPLANYWRLRLDHASLTIVDTFPEGAVLSLLNDCHYLQGGEDLR